jgi:tetratricopeptide (TPR) repeat protein
MAEEKSRKELLEEPDPFMVFANRMLKIAKEYQQQIVMGTLAVVLVAVVISALIYFKHQSEDQAALMLGNAIARYNAIEYKDPKVINPKPPSIAEYEGVKKIFKEIVEKYGSTGAGKAALLHYADLCYKTQNYDEAIKIYKKALDVFEDKIGFKSLILNGLAYSYEDKKDYDSALKYFKMIATDKNAPMKDQALFNLAQIYEKLGKTDLQAEAYKRIISEYPDSMYYRLAKEKIAG